MSKPTKRVKKKITITLQMTDNRADRFERMLEIFVQAAKLQPYPNELLSDAKGDYLEVVSETKDA